MIVHDLPFDVFEIDNLRDNKNERQMKEIGANPKSRYKNAVRRE